MTRSSRHRSSTSTNRAAGKRTSAHAHATDLLLLAELHAHLPVGLLVNDAGTLEVLHANPPLPGFRSRPAARPAARVAQGRRRTAHRPGARVTHRGSGRHRHAAARARAPSRVPRARGTLVERQPSTASTPTAGGPSWSRSPSTSPTRFARDAYSPSAKRASRLCARRSPRFPAATSSSPSSRSPMPSSPRFRSTWRRSDCSTQTPSSISSPPAAYARLRSGASRSSRSPRSDPRR